MHRHINRQMLLAARRGQITFRELAALLLDRLVALCPGCREEAQAAKAEEVPLEAYRDPVGRTLQLGSQLLRREDDRHAADPLLALLRELSPEQRLLRVRNAPERFANVALGELLLEEVRGCLPHNPQGALGWAQVIEAVADSYSPPYYPHLILAIAHQGNAHRAMGHFDLARPKLHWAKELAVVHQVADARVGAELNSLLGSLYVDLRQFEDAAHHLEGSAALYKILGDNESLARVLMQLGILHAHLDDLPAALKADHAAYGLLDPELNPRLYVAARLNHAFHLVAAGDFLRAQEHLDYDRNLYEDYADSHTLIRVTWLEARTSAGLGDYATAERAYVTLRDHFTAEQHGFNAALVCLELATIQHERDDYEALRTTAAQAVELFQAYALHREALAALVLLYKAIEARTVTADTLLHVTEFLRRAQNDPAARYQEAN